ncbi:MAG: hypothetical protein AB1586_25325 [Pseudomonadota bacterium]
MVDSVFLLWHVRELPDDADEVKLLGVYSSALKAEEARAGASTLPGFRDYLEGFSIDEYRIDEVKWSEGFLTPDGNP